MEKHHATIRRPLHQHVFGRIGTWLPYAALFPKLVNRLQAGFPGMLAQRLLGLSTDKRLPDLAPERFMVWAKKQSVRHDPDFYWIGDQSCPPVVLWSDSVNSHYRPSILISAVNVLVACGFTVAIARRHFCCGRPLYEYGFLTEARQRLGQILERFHPRLPVKVPVVVLEPSCLSVFKDELTRLFPTDPAATELASRCMTLCDLLNTTEVKIRRTIGKGILHLHCHDKSLKLSSHEREWMELCFDELHEVDSGCCGMAGTYGMRKNTRSIATTLFNRRLKPAIERSDKTTVVVANGFSCHEQIQDHTGRTPLHPVQVIEACLSDS